MTFGFELFEYRPLNKLKKTKTFSYYILHINATIFFDN